MAISEYHGPALGGTSCEPAEPAATVVADPASNVIDFRAARARRYEEDGLEPEPIEDGPRYETPLEVSQRLCDEYRASLSVGERARLEAHLAPRLLSPNVNGNTGGKPVTSPEPPPPAPTPPMPQRAAVPAALNAKIERREFSAMLLAWSVNPAQQGMLPNVSLMAGVLVELCHRMDALEAPKVAPSPRKSRKRAKRSPSPAA